MKKAIFLLLLISNNVFADVETNCLAKTLYHEVRGATKRNKQAVGLVVLNRKKIKHSSICTIVNEHGQFDYVKRKLKVDKSSKEWKDILAFTIDFLNNAPKDFTNGSTHFHNTKVNPNWPKSKFLKTIKIDNHIFYKELA